jgi:putative oligomerization/nucleic acid binding protein
MRRRLGRGRGGPGLLGTAARTAVIAGTASAVAGRVDAAQQSAAQQQQQAAAAQEQLRQMQLQAQIDAQVDARMAGAPPAPTSARPSVDELHAQLSKLGELRQAGLLTDAEFAEQKARLLA